MTKYNGMFELILKLQEAYDKPTPRIYEPKKEKWVFMPKFPPVRATHNRTTKSFEDTERILKKIDNDPIWQLDKIQQNEHQQEQREPVLIKKLTLSRNTGNK